MHDLHVLKHRWQWSKKNRKPQYVISPEWDLLPVSELTLDIATNRAILYMHAKINNVQFGIGFTLKRSDLIKPQPPDNKRAVCIIPQMLPLPSWGNWFHGCSPRMLLNIWHLGIWKHIDVLLHVHRSLIETVKLFTVCRSHLFGGNHLFCQPAAVLINAGFLWPLPQTSQTSPFQKYVLKINIALNISHFEHYNFTYSSRQVASKHRAKILFSHISLFVSKFSL